MKKNLLAALTNRINNLICSLIRRIHNLLDLLYGYIDILARSNIGDKYFYEIGHKKLTVNILDILPKIMDEVMRLERLGIIVDSKKILSTGSYKEKIFLYFRNIRHSNIPNSLFEQYVFIDDPLRNIDYLEAFIYKYIIPFAEDVTGGHVSIENIQIYKTSPAITELTNEKFHLDGDLKRSFKIMFYLTDCGHDDGPLEIQGAKSTLVWTSKRGEGLAFSASTALHRGRRPVKNIRWVLNMKVYPAIFRSRIQPMGSKYLNATRRNILFLSSMR